MTPIRSGQPIARAFRSVNAIGSQLASAQTEIINLRHATTASGSRVIGADAHHPFQIYQIPGAYRETPDATDWRKVQVRTGAVFSGGTEIEVTGTDGVADPDSEVVGQPATDILCDADTAKYWFWVAISGTTASVDSGATAPAWDSSHIPIGYVDTLTHAADHQVIIRQMLRGDVLTVAGGIHWEGEWEDTSYTEGSLVTVSMGSYRGTYLATRAIEQGETRTRPEEGDGWAQLPSAANARWV